MFSLIGRIVGGRYEITGPLGEGGMARVFRARRLADGRLVAVKVLREQYAHDKELVARFEREAIAGAHVAHPNVAAATDFGQLDDGSYFLSYDGEAWNLERSDRDADVTITATKGALTRWLTTPPPLRRLDERELRIDGRSHPRRAFLKAIEIFPLGRQATSGRRPAGSLMRGSSRADDQGSRSLPR